MPNIQVGKRNAAILRGEEDVTEWSEEELVQGRRKASDGTWGGRRPKLVPTAVHDQLVKQTLSEANQLLLSQAPRAIEMLFDLAENAEDEGVRLKAVGMILDRVMGKVTEKIDLRAEVELKPWEEAIIAAVVPLPIEGREADAETG